LIELGVVCTECGAAAAHEVGAILLDHDLLEGADDAAAWTRAVYVALSLTCPKCAAIDAYTVVPASGRALEVDDEVVRAGRAALSDGTLINTPSDGIRHLQKRADAKPKDAKRWRALGNFAMRADHTDKALAAWRRGAEIDGELECALAVAVDAVARDHGDAPTYVARAVERLPHAEPQRRPLQSAQVAELLRQLNGAITLTLDGEPVETAAVVDWSRFGERLARARRIAARA